ncbi:MAG: class I SAM-dependent methyltransferase [Saprospiraceae bacterium]|nr:class I SAM-dependent methyltransferase [Saprospiraceae bacterium]
MKLPLIFSILFASLVIISACKNNGNDSVADQEDMAREDHKWSQDIDFEEKVSVYEDENRDIWQKPDRVIDILAPLEDKVVVDLGAGTGYFAFRLVQKAQKVIAVDIDQDFVNFMEKKRLLLPLEQQDKFEVRLAEAQDPHIHNEEADAVLIVNTYAYLQNRIKYFANLKKGLKPGAELVIIEFKMKNIPNGPPEEEKVSISTVQSELNAAGFQDIDVDDRTLDYQYIVTAHTASAIQ